MNQADQQDGLKQCVLIPGGTGTVGTGVVRAFLEAGAEVVVPTRSAGGADRLRAALGLMADHHLHLVEHDYTSFAGAHDLVEQIVSLRGGLDSVVAPIGGWWAGGPLMQIGEQDWSSAFTNLATTHMAVLRASLPVMSSAGAYVVVVGDSAAFPVPGSGLVSMEQAALSMMQRVAAAEQGQTRRVFTFTLGAIADNRADNQVRAADVGLVAVAASAASAVGSRDVPLHDQAEVAAALQMFGELG